ncbi:MAG: hypothetical protein LC648_10995 [Novosphingobium sp.]|nr:hypothetical protein [Novosphingobium sp.]
MRKPIASFIAVAAALAVSAADARPRISGEEKLARLLEGRVAGDPTDCIYLPRVRSSRIIDDTAIVYDAGSVIYVNRPRGGAYGLDDDDVMVTQLFGGGSSLCSIDVVRTHDRSTFFYTGFVSLGEFVPYRKVRARN